MCLLGKASFYTKIIKQNEDLGFIQYIVKMIYIRLQNLQYTLTLVKSRHLAGYAE